MRGKNWDVRFGVKGVGIKAKNNLFSEAPSLCRGAEKKQRAEHVSSKLVSQQMGPAERTANRQKAARRAGSRTGHLLRG